MSLTQWNVENLDKNRVLYGSTELILDRSVAVAMDNILRTRNDNRDVYILSGISGDRDGDNWTPTVTSVNPIKISERPRFPAAYFYTDDHNRFTSVIRNRNGFMRRIQVIDIHAIDMNDFVHYLGTWNTHIILAFCCSIRDNAVQAYLRSIHSRHTRGFWYGVADLVDIFLPTSIEIGTFLLEGVLRDDFHDLRLYKLNHSDSTSYIVHGKNLQMASYSCSKVLLMQYPDDEEFVEEVKRLVNIDFDSINTVSKIDVLKEYLKNFYNLFGYYIQKEQYIRSEKLWNMYVIENNVTIHTTNGIINRIDTLVHLNELRYINPYRKIYVYSKWHRWNI